MKRIFAHNLIFGGRHYPCHVFEYDEASGRTALYPFSGEIHSTRFFPGSVEVTLADGDVVAGPPDIPVMLFEPYTKTTMWGGTRISGLKGSLHATVEKVGESWEVSAMPGKESRVAGGPLDGNTVASLTERYGPALLGFGVYGRHGGEFPLLVKFLDAADNLSLQVHPSDSMAARRNAGHGKDEMWYVVDASPGARVFTGFSSPMTPGAFVSAVSGGNIMDAVSSRLSRPGDSFFIPAGTVHCLGAGNLVLEIQDASDISYRIYDFGRSDGDRARPLHIDDAREAIDYTHGPGSPVTPVAVDRNIENLVSAPNFRVDRIRVDGAKEIDLRAIDSFIILTCTEGCVTVADDRDNTVRLRAGTTAMVPAVAARLSFAGNATVIATRSPL